jgi:hypothetical protein
MLARALHSNPGVLSLTLLAPSLLSFGSAAKADWLVTNDGAAIETRGTWEIKGEMVIFTSPGGVLSSLPLSAVDLEASEAHGRAMARAAAGALEAQQPTKGTAVLVLTDADVRHVDPEVPVLPEEQAETEAAGSAASQSSPAELVVVDWEENLDFEQNSLEIVGSLRNAGRNPATSILLNVLLYNDSGTLLGKSEARLVKAALNPGESTRFVASFSSSLTFSEAKFDIQSRGFRARDSSAAEEDGEEGEEQVPEGS